jgi:two-component sensor histidine kinase
VPEELENAFLDSQGRVKAMALMHQQLYEHKTYESIGASKYSSELVSLITRSHTAGGSQNIETVLVPPDEEVFLTMDQALPFGLLLNELVTNSIKHAFTEQNEGEIRISMSQKGDMSIVIVEDNGKGVDEGIELGKTSSLGFQLIPGLVEQLDGEIALIRDHGTRYEIRFRKQETER